MIFIVVAGAMIAWLVAGTVTEWADARRMGRRSADSRAREEILRLVPSGGERWMVIWCLDSDDRTIGEWAPGGEVATMVWMAL